MCTELGQDKVILVLIPRMVKLELLEDVLGILPHGTDQRRHLDNPVFCRQLGGCAVA